MAKDLSAALQALTEQAQGQTSRVDKALPAGRDIPAIPARSGSSGPMSTPGVAATAFVLRGEKTITSSDGIFTFHFPETLETTLDDKVLTIGVIKAVPR
jgi:hypothetical protein